MSLIPLIILFCYITFVYGRSMQQEKKLSNELIQESYVNELDIMLQKIEFISNICYDPAVQKLLDEPYYSQAQFYNTRQFLFKYFTAKVDLFKIIDSLQSISIEINSKQIFNIKGENRLPVSRRKEINKHLLDYYKYQTIVPIEEGSKVYVYSRAIRSVNNYGNNIGTFYIVLDLKSSFDQFEEYTERTHSFFTLTNKEGVVLYTNYKGGSEVKQLSEEQLKAYHIVEYPLNHLGLTVTYYDQVKQIMQPINQLRNLTLMMIVLTYISIFIISRKVTEQLVSPILKLKERTEKVKQGDYSREVMKQGQSDELGELQQSFDEMTAQIDFLVNEVYSRQLSEKEAIINSLTAQINPHFLYNTLDMVKSMAEIEGIEEIGEITKALSLLFRYVTKTNQPIVTVQEEVANLENYIKIIDARFGKKIEFNIQVDQDIRQYTIIKLCLQPLVENSITHGLKQRNGMGKITIEIKKEDSFLVIKQYDNGEGMQEEALKQLQQNIETSAETITTSGQGIGLYNINRRLKLYYGETYGLKLKSDKGEGMMVIIKIPLSLEREM